MRVARGCLMYNCEKRRKQITVRFFMRLRSRRSTGGSSSANASDLEQLKQVRSGRFLAFCPRLYVAELVRVRVPSLFVVVVITRHRLSIQLCYAGGGGGGGLNNSLAETRYLLCGC